MATASRKVALAIREMTDHELEEAVAREWNETLDAYQRELEEAMAEHLAEVASAPRSSLSSLKSASEKEDSRDA